MRSLGGDSHYPVAMSRHADEVAELVRSVLNSAGSTDPALRRAVFTGVDVPDPWAAYVRKVRHESYRLTDSDVEKLIRHGCTEDQVFEVTIAAALGAASVRLEAGLRALSGGG